ncbi:MAG TPA: hypothetical protein VN812_03405 [Candidatus Acidoferrales bacterium]|nr:hypothetical protein [Candidatus Acidoferrales bacterium]
MSESTLEMCGLPAVCLPEEPVADWLLTWAGSALDGMVMQAMRRVIDATLMPAPAELPALRASAAAFVGGDLETEPRRFFAFVDAPPAPLSGTARHRRSISGGTIVSRRFATGYTPYCAPGARPEERPPAAAADALRVEHWMHEPGRGRATVVAVHGFSMGYPRIDAVALFAAPCFRAGYDIALVTLPFHGARTPPEARFSGEWFAVPHVARLNEAARQAVYELYALTTWLRAQSGAPVGLLGLSLGGYLSALMAGLTASLDFVIPMVPPVCFGDLAWRFFSHSRYHRDATAAFSHAELRRIYRVHSPLTYPPRVEKRRLLILAGRGDQIVPPEHPHALWRHWGEPEIYWFSGSHLAPFRRGRLLARILEHLEDTVSSGSDIA